MFVSCFRTTGWELLSFSAILYHSVNWLIGSDHVAKMGTFLSVSAFLLQPLVSSVPSLHCQTSCKGPPGTRACGSVTRARTHAHTHTLFFIQGQGDELWCFKVSLSQWCTCALMCVPVWIWEKCRGKPRMRKQSSWLPLSLLSLSRWNFRCCWMSCQQVFCKINGGNIFLKSWFVQYLAYGEDVYKHHWKACSLVEM